MFKIFGLVITLTLSTLAFADAKMIAACAPKADLNLSVYELDGQINAVLSAPNYENYATNQVYMLSLSGADLKKSWNTLYVYEAKNAGLVTFDRYGRPSELDLNNLVVKDYYHIDVMTGLTLFSVFVFETLDGQVLGKSMHFLFEALSCPEL